MRVLIIKLSSLGDMIHTLPALTDAGQMIPDIEFDWVAEEAFTEVPKWHPLVKTVIPIAIRRWRKTIFKSLCSGDYQKFFNTLRLKDYDCVIDAQGILKSAVITSLAKGTRIGYCKQSLREPIARLFYQRKLVKRPISCMHAITAIRYLFAEALGYTINDQPDYGIVNSPYFQSNSTYSHPYLFFSHSTTWSIKHWPEHHWIKLIRLAEDKNFNILLSWGNEIERVRAERLKAQGKKTTVLPKMSLTDLGKILLHAKASVAVDTGLGHLAAALGVPGVSLYGPTSPAKCGTMGQHQTHLVATTACDQRCKRVKCAKIAEHQPACLNSITSTQAWNALTQLC